jgi:small conductance mechanosensitive channel
MEQSVAEASAAIDQVITLITTYGLDVIGAVAILVIGWIAAGWAQRAVSKGLAKTGKVDDMLRGFFSSLVRYFVIVFTVLAVLSQFGIETTSLIAVFGAAGLAVGLALQGTLSDLAAGVMPFSPSLSPRTTSRSWCPTARSGARPLPTSAITPRGASTW